MRASRTELTTTQRQREQENHKVCLDNVWEISPGETKCLEEKAAKDK